MGEHYCCKTCGQEYYACTCPGLPPAPPSPAKECKVKKRRKMTAPSLNDVETYIDKLADFNGPLFVLKAEVQELIDSYGPTATISFDAGHNNVQVIITHKPPYYGTLESFPDSALSGETQLTVGLRYRIFEKREDGMLFVATDSPQVCEWVHAKRFSNISIDPVIQ